MRDFQTDRYVGVLTEDRPYLIDPELLQYLARTPGRGSMQNATQGTEVPWPGSLQDLAAHSEPASTPA
jgi:hypothetical protein